MTKSSRRIFLKASAISAAGIANSSAFAQSPGLSQKVISEVEALQAQGDI